MGSARPCDFDHILFLVQTGQYEHARRLLYSPYLFLLGSLPKDNAADKFFRTMEKVDPAFADFIRLHLLTEFFLLPERRESAHRRWLKKHASPERFFPKQSFDRLADAIWRAVPVGVVSADRSRIYYLICGFSADAVSALPLPWAGRLLDKEARDSVAVAARAAEKLAGKPGKGLIVYPLLPDRGEPQITGSSFGLPLAMGLWSLLTGKSINPGLVMTGIWRNALSAPLALWRISTIGTCWLKNSEKISDLSKSRPGSRGKSLPARCGPFGANSAAG